VQDGYPFDISLAVLVYAFNKEGILVRAVSILFD